MIFLFIIYIYLNRKDFVVVYIYKVFFYFILRTTVFSCIMTPFAPLMNGDAAHKRKEVI